MSGPWGRRFTRRGGGVRATLSTPEVGLLTSLPGELRSLYEGERGSVGDPVRDRLFPRAYLDPTAEDAEREWRELVQPELVSERVAALELLAESIGRATPKRGRVVVDLDESETAAWMGVLNDARLALGTRLEISEELDWSRLDPDDPSTPAYAAYAWLTELQSDLVEVLLPTMPD